jgi:hypothetical protein
MDAPGACHGPVSDEMLSNDMLRLALVSLPIPGSNPEERPVAIAVYSEARRDSCKSEAVFETVRPIPAEPSIETGRFSGCKKYSRFSEGIFARYSCESFV